MLLKNVAKNAAKQGVKSLLGRTVRHVGADFVSEAVEEGLAEIVAPYYARMTYDPDARAASMEEVAYAAFIGGLSGVLLGGAGRVVEAGANAHSDRKSGQAAVDAGQEGEILALAASIAKDAETGESPVLDAVKNTYNRLEASLKETGGEITGNHQLRLLGSLRRNNAVARLLPEIERSALAIARNPEAAAERYTAIGIKDENGNPIEITAEKLLEGVELTEDADKSVRSLRRAISQNRTLGTLAIADVVGKMIIDAEKYARVMVTSDTEDRRGEYQAFMEQAPAEVKVAMAHALGLEADRLDGVDYKTFHRRRIEYLASPEGKKRVTETKKLRADAEAVPENRKSIPNVIDTGLADGVHRFGGKDGIAILKDGDTVRIFDYETRNVTRSLSFREANVLLQKHRRAAEDVAGVAESKTPTAKTADVENEHGESLVETKRYAIKYPSYSEQDVAQNKETLAEMAAVATIGADKLEKTGKTPKEMFSEYFALLGNSIYSEEFGDIALKKSSVKSEIRHGLTAEKIASMEAIPAVIERGKVIFQKKKTGTDVDRIIVAAPIKIGITDYYMGVMLQRDSVHQRLYLHNVVSIKTEEANIPSQDISLTNWSDEGDSLLLTTSILQNAIDVKLQKQKNSAKIKIAESSTRRDAGEKQTGTTLRELDAWAKENVRGYKDLLPAERREIRATVRQGRALGLTDAEIKSYADVAVRTGVRISFSKERTRYVKMDGSTAYGDGFYDPKSNEIVVNPEGTRSAARLLFHELSHTLYGSKRFEKALVRAARRMDDERAEQIKTSYEEAGRTDVAELAEEIAVHHAEDVLGNRENLERLLRDEPTIGEKILSFFGLAKTEYAGNPRLTRAAGRLYRHFEAALGAFSEANRGNLAADPLTRINSKNMQVSADGRRDAIVALEDGKVYVEASRRIITGTTKSEQRKQITDFFSRLLKNKPSIDIHTIEGDVLTISKDETAQKARDDHKTVAGKRVEMSADEFLVKLHVESHIDEITEISKKRGKGKADDKGHSFVDNGFTYRTAYFKDFDGQYYEVTLSIGHKGTVATVYNVGKIEEGVSPTAKIIAVAESQLLLETPSDTSISDSSEKINPSGEKNSSNRAALPSEPYTSATSEHVGKERPRYEPSRKERFFTMKDRAYIETVDEMYGAVKYLRKVGGLSKAEAEVAAQMARSTMNQAQAMIGSVQYNVFSEKPERMGDGLLEIYKPVKKWSAEKQNDFELFLLHRLNIDRMTLEQRSRAWAAPLRNAVQTLEGEVRALSEELNTLRAELQSGNTAIDRARIRRGIVKTDAAKVRWQERIDAITSDIFGINQRINEAEKALSAKETALKRAQADYDAAIIPNRPVFGKDETLDENGNMRRDHDVTAAESRAFIDSLKKKYGADFSTFEATADKLYGYLDNLQTMRVTAELISQERADHMKKLYPHYVPAYRVKNGSGVAPVKGKNAMEVATTVRRAKGGNADIVAVEQSIAEQTMELMKAGQINLLADKVYDAAKASGDTTYVEILEESTVGEKENQEINTKVADVISRAIGGKGKLDEKYNQVPISDFPADVAEMVSRASEGLIDVSKKKVAIEGGKIWHEYRRRSDAKQEQGRRQVPMTADDMVDAVAAIYDPDLIEALFATTDNPTQAQSFAYAKKTAQGHYVVVEVVGGKNNPNVVPQMLLHFDEDKWADVISSSKSLGEILFENERKKRESLDIEFNKKNRVIVAQRTSQEAVATTPHSPRSTISISDSSEKINPFEENFEGRDVATQEILRPKSGQLTFYKDGKRVTMKVSKELLVGFDGLRSPSVEPGNPITQVLAWLNQRFKGLVTSYNPLFGIRNAIRDLQDAGLNSKHPARFAKNVTTLRALKMMLENSKEWELYRAMGGFSSTVYEGSLKLQGGYAGFESLASVFFEGKVTAGALRAAWKKIHYLLDQYSGVVGDLVLPATSQKEKQSVSVKPTAFSF